MNKIGEEQILKASDILNSYKKGKKKLEDKIVANEKWWKFRHWEEIKSPKNTEKPVSGWMFNAIANKHADAMDNYPAPNVLPREESDEEAAEKLSSVLPVMLEYNRFPQTYSDVWWYKLKQGTGVYQVVWDKNLENGLGDISIRKADLLNLFWEPGITDIQKSPNLFYVELRDIEQMKEMYPDIDFSADQGDVLAQYVHDESIDVTNKVMVIDWYYKKKGKLHYCQYANKTILRSTENEEESLYDHNKYPFVFDVMYPEEDSPAGFGLIDIIKCPQTYIDKLDGAILKNALVASKKKVITRVDCGINRDELMDPECDVVTSSSSLGQDDFRELTYQPLSPIFESLKQSKIEELKEVAGNRDFSQGATTSGVTSASAIVALQQSGSKLSRDIIDASYRAFTEICYLVIELIRQFYTEERTFRITNENGYEFVKLDNSEIRIQSQGEDFGEEMGERLPIFDVKVVPEKDSGFAKLSNNELALQFFQLGFFRPDMVDQALATVGMMKFEGKDKVISKINENASMYDQLKQMQAQLVQLSSIVDMQNGTNLTQEAQIEAPMQGNAGTVSVKPNTPTIQEKAASAARNQASPA